MNRYKTLRDNCVRLPAVTSSLRTKKKLEQLSLLCDQGACEGYFEPCHLPTLTRGKGGGATTLEVNSFFTDVPSFPSARSQSLRKFAAGKHLLNRLSCSSCARFKTANSTQELPDIKTFWHTF